MMKKILFQGAGTAIITPMKEDDSIHYSLFGELLDRQVQENADAVIVAGTTGEASTLTDEEHFELVQYAVRRVNGRLPVIAGAGSNNTAHAAFLSRECERAGADGLLHVTPYYNKASQQGLFSISPNVPRPLNCLSFSTTSLPGPASISFRPRTSASVNSTIS